MGRPAERDATLTPGWLPSPTQTQAVSGWGGWAQRDRGHGRRDHTATCPVGLQSQEQSCWASRQVSGLNTQ